MFGIGLPEMIVILAVALVVVGPEKLPELARSLAKGVVELKRTMHQLKHSLTEEGELDSVETELRDTRKEIQKQLIDNDFQVWQPEAKPKEEKADTQQPSPRPWEKDRPASPDSAGPYTEPDEQSSPDVSSRPPNQEKPTDSSKP